jgi:hypothetical protein
MSSRSRRLAAQSDDPLAGTIAISVRRTADTLDRSPSTVRRWIKEGKLRGIQMGTRTLSVATDSIRALTAERTD